MEEEAVPSPQVPLSDSQIITTMSTPVAPTPPHREPLVKSRPKITYVDKVSDISMAQGFLPEDKDSLHNTGIPQNYAVRRSGTSSKGRSLYLCDCSLLLLHGFWDLISICSYSEFCIDQLRIPFGVQSTDATANGGLAPKPPESGWCPRCLMYCV